MLKSNKRKSKKSRNPRFVSSPAFDTEEYFKESIEREILAKSRINIESKDGKFHIVGIIKKKNNNYVVEVEDKFGKSASVKFKAEDVLSEDYESATLTLR